MSEGTMLASEYARDGIVNVEVVEIGSGELTPTGMMVVAGFDPTRLRFLSCTAVILMADRVGVIERCPCHAVGIIETELELNVCADGSRLYQANAGGCSWSTYDAPNALETDVAVDLSPEGNSGDVRWIVDETAI